MDREADRQRVLALHLEGLGPRAIARETGVPASTVKRWVDQTPQGAGPGHSTKGLAGADEAEVAALLLRKSTNLLRSLDLQPTAKDRSDQANAVAKLLDKYLALVGEPIEEVNVNVNEGTDINAAIAYLLKPAIAEADA